MPAFDMVSGRSRTAAAALLLTLALATGACSGSDSSSSPQGAPNDTSSGGGNEGPAVSAVKLGKVAGTIKKKNWKTFMSDHRKTMLKQVGEAVDTWIDGGYVGVDYPRDAFDSAFDAFTEQAKRDANAQKKLMTNWDLRQEIDGVDVKKRTMSVDVMAPRGRPTGATARVRFVFTTTGDTQERVTVRGRLFLVPGHGKWRIFGYDISRGST